MGLVEVMLAILFLLELELEVFLVLVEPFLNILGSAMSSIWGRISQRVSLGKKCGCDICWSRVQEFLAY